MTPLGQRPHRIGICRWSWQNAARRRIVARRSRQSKSERRAFDIVVDYFADDPDGTRSLAMERIIQGNPALTAGQLERVARTQAQLLDIVRERIGRHDPTDPRAAAIVGAALSCLIAAKSTWVDSNRARPFGDLLDEAMAAIKPA